METATTGRAARCVIQTFDPSKFEGVAAPETLPQWRFFEEYEAMHPSPPDRPAVETTIRRALGRLGEDGLVIKASAVGEEPWSVVDGATTECSEWTLTPDGKHEFAALHHAWTEELDALAVKYGSQRSRPMRLSPLPDP